MAEATVMTVRGPIPAAELGVTLMHEHVLIDQMREVRMDGLVHDVPLAIEELGRFKAAGGRTLVDLTNRSLGQDAAALRRISEVTGLNVILGCALYRHQYFDAAWVDRMPTGDLADWIVRDVEEGIDGTGVRPGIIGEVAMDRYLTAQEERVFRAAARAQRRTGLTLSTHAARWPVGLVQLDLLEEEGVDPRRVIIGHCDTVFATDWTSVEDAFAYHDAIARRGAWVQFDSIQLNEFELERRLRYVLAMRERGLLGQVLLSHDVNFKSNLHAYGGGGYDLLLTRFVPDLRKAGLADEEIETLIVHNPRRALTGTIG